MSGRRLRGRRRAARVAAADGVAFAAVIVVAVVVCSCGPDLSLLAARQVAGFQEIIASGAVHVAPSGSDANPGSPSSPKATPEAAVAVAARLIERGDVTALEVRLAAGSYALWQTLAVPAGVTLLGGYDPVTWRRDPAQVSLLDLQAGGTVVELTGHGSRRLAGLTMRSAAAQTVIGVSSTGADVVITGCTVDATAGRAESVGILIDGGSAVVDANTVVFGGADDYSAGIAVMDATARIRNNVVTDAAGPGSTATGPSVCVHCSESDVGLLNNTLHGGRSPDEALVLLAGAQAEVINNILLGSGACCGIRLTGDGGVTALRSNDFLTCTEPILRSASGDEYGTVGEVEAYLGSVASSNLADADPFFADFPGGDYHITVNPVAGVDLSAEFTADRDSVPRTLPWSIGAYELD